MRGDTAFRRLFADVFALLCGIDDTLPLSGVTAQPFAEAVVDDADDPGAERGIAPEGRQRLPDTDPDILSDVLKIVVANVGQFPTNRAADGGAMPGLELGEGSLISLLR